MKENQNQVDSQDKISTEIHAGVTLIHKVLHVFLASFTKNIVIEFKMQTQEDCRLYVYKRLSFLIVFIALSDQGNKFAQYRWLHFILMDI